MSHSTSQNRIANTEVKADFDGTLILTANPAEDHDLLRVQNADGEVLWSLDHDGEPSSGGGGSGTGFTNTDGALSIESDVEDGASAVAFSFATAEPLVGEEGAFRSLIQCFNGPTDTGTRVFRVRSDGGLSLGSSVDESGEADEAIGAIEISRNVANGDNTVSEIYMENKDSDDYNVFAAFQVDIGVPDPGAYSYLGLDASAREGIQNRLQIVSKEGANQISVGTKFGAQLFDWRPDAADGTTCYIYDCSIEHTSGFIAEVKNHTATVFKIGIAGEIVLTPMTKAARNALTAAEGMMVMQSDNTPGPRWYVGGHWQKVALTTDD